MSRLFKNKEFLKDASRISAEVHREINMGLTVLNKIKKPIVTFFGSHKANRENPLFEHCYTVAKHLGKDGYVILTGGDSGFAYAASLGAKDSNTETIGLQSSILKADYKIDGVFTDTYSFEFLFARRFLLALKSEALVFYPGGYATLNELFEYLLLMETNIVDTVPIICVGKEFWQGMKDWLIEEPEKSDYFTKASDLNLFTIVDTEDQVLALVKE